MGNLGSEQTDTNAVALSVVVPAHNSVGVIESTLRRLAQRLAGLHAEIVVVENGSTDTTRELCHELAAAWDNPGVRLSVICSAKGMGNALHTGASATRGARVLLTADDLPFGFDDLDADTAFGQSPPLVVVGSKAHPDSVIGRGFARATMTAGFAVLRRLVLNLRTRDPQGTFLMDGPLLRSLLPRLREPGFLFTTELAYALELQGIRPIEVPVHLSAAHSAHATRISRADVVSMGLGLLRLRRRRAEFVGDGRGKRARR